MSSKKTGEFFKRLLPAFALSVAMAFMLGVYEPVVLYFHNKNEFWYDLYLLLPVTLLMFLGIFLLSAVAFAVCCLVNGKLYHIAVVGYTILFLATYVQGNYLVGHLPPQDGTPVAWSAYDNQRWHTIILWIAVTAIVLTLVKLAKMARFLKGICYLGGGVTLVLLVTMVTVCIETDGLEEKKDMSMTTRYELEMSTDQNLVLLIVDSVDGTRLSEMLAEHSEYKETFRDFTCFENTMACYPYTMFAVPFILSGDWFECDEWIAPYIANAYRDAELFRELEERGYRMGTYVGEAPLTDSSMFRFENVVEDTGKFESVIDFVKLELRMVGLKYAPYDLKQFCMMLPEEIPALRERRDDIERVVFDDSNIQFYDNLREDGVTLSEEKCFRLIHIEGPHVPFRYDKDVNVIENATYDSGLEATMTILDAYLQALKDSGVYDNTAIMILSDHGYNCEEPDSKYPNNRQHAALLVKGIGEKHEVMQNSQAPISQEDYQEAYIRLLDGKNSSEVFDWKEGDNRERRYLWFELWDRDAMEEYVQTGYAGDTETLIPTGRTYKQH